MPARYYALKSYPSSAFGVTTAVADYASDVKYLLLSDVERALPGVPSDIVERGIVDGMPGGVVPVITLGEAYELAEGHDNEYRGFIETIAGDLASNFASTKPRAMISQPMAGLPNMAILEARDEAKRAVEAMGYEFISTLFWDDYAAPRMACSEGAVSVPLYFLARSIDIMARCHAVYFCNGWQDARGCRAEWRLANDYGLRILYQNSSVNEDEDEGEYDYV